MPRPRTSRNAVVSRQATTVRPEKDGPLLESFERTLLEQVPTLTDRTLTREEIAVVAKYVSEYTMNGYETVDEAIHAFNGAYGEICHNTGTGRLPEYTLILHRTYVRDEIRAIIRKMFEMEEERQTTARDLAHNIFYIAHTRYLSDIETKFTEQIDRFYATLRT